jgi:hypothetical protein
VNDLSVVWERVDYNGKRIRLTSIQIYHISFFHPEVLVKEEMLISTLAKPDIVTEGGGPKIRVLYRSHENTPVGDKYLAIVLKELNEEGFIVTSYFTDSIRRKRVIWKKTSS